MKIVNLKNFLLFCFVSSNAPIYDNICSYFSIWPDTGTNIESKKIKFLGDLSDRKKNNCESSDCFDSNYKIDEEKIFLFLTDLH